MLVCARVFFPKSHLVSHSCFVSEYAGSATRKSHELMHIKLHMKDSVYISWYYQTTQRMFLVLNSDWFFPLLCRDVLIIRKRPSRLRCDDLRKGKFWSFRTLAPNLCWLVRPFLLHSYGIEFEGYEKILGGGRGVCWWWRKYWSHYG